MKRRTIEQRAKEEWGTTTVPQFAVYMLLDGDMLNGSFGGFQRDRDHREINEFMPKLNNGKPYEGYPYIQRFINRGNIRMNCNRESINLQFWKTPTYEQWKTIRWIIKEAEELKLKIRIEKYYSNNKKTICFYDRESFVEWLSSQVNWCLY